MDFLSGLFGYVVPFVFVLSLVVFIHEMGHFLVARWFGIIVEQFSIGFGREVAGWTDKQFAAAGFRAVPGSIVRHSAFIAPGVVLMPSFVNLGAYVDEGTMVDTWATVGSCAQIGKNCHISGGAGIGGVLEPLQAAPVIIEDDCFIGARSEVAEGVRVGRGSVLSMGVFLGASTRIIDRETGEFLNDPESWLCSAEHGYLWRVGSQLVLSYKHDTGDKRRNRALRSQVGQMPRRPTRRVP